MTARFFSKSAPLSSHELNHVRCDFKSHRKGTDQFTIDLNEDILSCRAYPGRLQKADAFAAFRYPAEHGKGKKAQVAETVDGVDHADLDVRLSQARFRRDREVTAVTRGFTDGREGGGMGCSIDLQSEHLRFPLRQVLQACIPERSLANPFLQCRTNS